MNFSLLHLFIFFGASVSLIMALEVLIIKHEEQLKGITPSRVLTYILSSFFLYFFALNYQANELYTESFFYPILIFSLFLFGPLYYYISYRIFIKLDAFKPLYAIHTLPAICFGIIEYSFYYSKNSNYHNIIFLLAISHAILYTSLIIIKIFIFWKNVGLDKIIKTTIIAISIVNLVLVMLFIARYYSLYNFVYVPIILLNIFMISWHFIGRAEPNLFKKLILEIGEKRYNRSLLTGLSTEDIQGKLLSLMEDEKLFCDEDLSLKSLAYILQLSPQQLSEFLNQFIGIKFKTFINKYRINEAKELLLQEVHRSVLSIGYSVGFNSKTAFYEAFSKMEKTSPNKYRKEKQEKIKAKAI